MPKFKKGDIVIRFREPKDKEWERVGKVSIDRIPIGKEFHVMDAADHHNGILINGVWYPSEAFELTNQEPSFKFML